MDKQNFGRKINYVRKEKEITSEGLACLCGVNPVFIRQIEAGVRSPSLLIFIKICNALKVSPNYFLEKELTYEQEDQKEIYAILNTFTPKQLEILKNIVKALQISFQEEQELPKYQERQQANKPKKALPPPYS